MRLAVAALLLLPLSAASADLQEVTVDRQDGIYTMHSRVRFDASLRQLYDVFIDWDQSTKFSSVVVESRNVEPDETGQPGFYSRNRVCVAFFCRSFERRGYVETEPYEWIRASVDPDRSDFYLSNESWQFVQQGDGVVVIYDLEFKPKFWVPPLIGPYMIKRKLKTDGPEALMRIDSVAQELQ